MVFQCCRWMSLEPPAGQGVVGLCEAACSNIWHVASCSRLGQVACITELSNLFSVWSPPVCLDACPSDLPSTTVHVNIVLRLMRTSCIWSSSAFLRAVTSLLIYSVQTAYGRLFLQRCEQSHNPMFVLFTNQQRKMLSGVDSSPWRQLVAWVRTAWKSLILLPLQGLLG